MILSARMSLEAQNSGSSNAAANGRFIADSGEADGDEDVWMCGRGDDAHRWDAVDGGMLLLLLLLLHL